MLFGKPCQASTGALLKNHEILVSRPAWKERLLVALKESGALEPERVKK